MYRNFRLRTWDTENQSTETCESDWTERDFGSRIKCFKSIGEHRIDEAANACKQLGASLPLPRSRAEQDDLMATADALGVSRNGR